MRLSVIIPVYNVVRDLPSCLDSVLASARCLLKRKNGNDIEIICIDDGSTDGSDAILDVYASPSHSIPGSSSSSTLFIHVIHQPNEGVAAARNRGLELATGDWFTFVDGDDVVRDDWLMKVVDACGSYPEADLVMYGMNPLYTTCVEWPADAHRQQVVSLSSEIGDLFVGVSVCQLAYRRKVCADMRFPCLTVGEDLVFTVRAFARARSCVVLPSKMYGYRYRADSATHTGLSARKLRDAVAFHVEMFRVLSASGKRLGRAFVEGRGRMWLEELPRELLARRKTPEGRAVYEAWLDSTAVAADLPVLPAALRRRARRVASARTAWSVFWNCRLPAWLRRKLRPLPIP